MPADVVAVGARTPVGLRAESAAAAVRAGITRVGIHPTLVDGSGNHLKAAWDFLLGESVVGPARLVELAFASLTEVVSKIVAHRSLRGALPLFLALPEPRPGFEANAIREVVHQLNARPVPGVTSFETQAVGFGHAGAVQALEMALRYLAGRQSDVCIVGGTDSYLDAETLDWLDQEGRLTQEDVRGGFTPGEGAGMFALVAAGRASAFGLRPLARVRRVAIGQERRSIDSAEGLLGEQMADVIRQATDDLRVPPQLIDDVYCDINGERHRVDDWGFAVLRVPSVFRDGSAYVTPVDCWGDLGAASGALGCVLATEAFRRQYSKGPLALVCGSSDGGLRGAALLERFEG
jgi:3-oxoacyl-[acyl-carrier-protein] synthase I